MQEKRFETDRGAIRYWVNDAPASAAPQLVFLPGLTADHRLFEKQVEHFEKALPVLVWDAPGHAGSWPFELDFSLADKARWLAGILEREGFSSPVIVGQSMGGYLGQMFGQLYPEKLAGFVSIDSAPLQRRYYTAAELWLLKKMEPVYRHYPWKTLLRQGTEGVAASAYGRRLMYEMMMGYDGDQERYARLSGHGFRMLAEAVEAGLPYEIKCPALLICGEKDHAGSTIRYNKAWHKQSALPLVWIEGAGHNSNTDRPERVNAVLEDFLNEVRSQKSITE